ncbi:GIY-YIG nuclease family protein [Iningainema tapete]|uniref:GIY-YIG nuclease family protein n=1 Tax=Iningainema tapete BLCC-T55 TaxID=2748662 RepID=A0A8J7C9I0_9CYAN|nr:GIY-YIG nuclease family protein [Iningainema tapete]MBD2770985.1 GIY-YIG nuclease family protein [Iningainema tapete BLCC-T55]
MSQGSIYIMENPAFRENLLKIGKTEGSPQKRAKQLFTTGVPDEFTVSYEEDVPDCTLVEKLIHQKLSNYRYKKNREFFVLPLQEAISKIQKVTQREFYHYKESYPWHFFTEQMTMRWFCHEQDFIFIARYENPLLSNKLQIIDLFNCGYGDQFMITNRSCDDPAELASDAAIKGFLIDVIDIYPGDRIAWIGRIRDEFAETSQFSILSILDCESYAKMARCPQQFIQSPEGLPIPMSDLFWCYQKETPALSTLREAVSKIKEMGIPNIWGRPDISLF